MSDRRPPTDFAWMTVRPVIEPDDEVPSSIPSKWGRRIVIGVSMLVLACMVLAEIHRLLLI